MRHRPDRLIPIFGVSSNFIPPKKRAQVSDTVWLMLRSGRTRKKLTFFGGKKAFMPVVGGRLKLKDAKSFISFGILVRMKELVA